MTDDISYQCWICPTCHDDHAQGADCTPEVTGEFDPGPDDRSYIAIQYRLRVEERDSLEAELASERLRVAGLVRALEEISKLDKLTMHCDPADFDFDAEEAYSAGATNAFCDAAETARDALAAFRKGTG